MNPTEIFKQMYITICLWMFLYRMENCNRVRVNLCNIHTIRYCPTVENVVVLNILTREYYLIYIK